MKRFLSFQPLTPPKRTIYCNVLCVRCGTNIVICIPVVFIIQPKLPVYPKLKWYIHQQLISLRRMYNITINNTIWWQYYSVSGFCLMLLWCPCMEINVNVQYNGGFLPDIILLTQCYIHWGTCLIMKRFLSLQPLTPPKRFDISSPYGGCSKSLGAVWIFFKLLKKLYQTKFSGVNADRENIHSPHCSADHEQDWQTLPG